LQGKVASRSISSDLQSSPVHTGNVASVSDLEVSFERNGRVVRALRQVSLDLRPGEIFGLVGESGSGKSVLGLSMLGLLPKTRPPKVSGAIEVCGLDMVNSSEGERRELRHRSLGAVFQDPMTSLNPTMRIGRQLENACGDPDEVVRLLKAVGVPEATTRLRSFPHELSGGQRQRIMIAMALAGDPQLVIADEPTTALDVTVQAQILELMRDLCDEFGTTIVYVTHDLGVAAQISDRIGVLYAGRLVETGPTASLLAEPAHPYTIGLLRSRLTLSSERKRPLLTLGGEPPDPRDLPPGCGFAPRCEHRIDACDVAVPPLVEIPESPERATACIRYRDLRTGSATTNGASSSATVTELSWPTRRDSIDELRPAALELVDVEKTFKIGGQPPRLLQALRGVSLRLAEGEAMALVGESGCGKSTLLRIAAGLMTPEAGSVHVGPGGRPQMVFQDSGASLTPWLTIGELVGARLREERMSRAQRAKRIDDVLHLVGLPAEVSAAKPGQLSGGMRQRVGIARAIVVPPGVLLCDEPTSALDVSLAATVLNLLGRLRRELGMAILFVTHDLAAARFVADRIAVIYLGRIVESGPAERVVGAPEHPYTEALLSAVPGTAGQRARLVGEPASPINPPAGCAFHPRCPEVRPDCSEQVPHLVDTDDHFVACFARPRAVPQQVSR
jgi:peptide/nickel transport system ATP-binding protein